MKNRITLLCIFFCSLICLTSCTNKYKSVAYFIDKNEFDKAIIILNKMSSKEKMSFKYNFFSGIAYLGKSISGYKRDSLNYFLQAEKYLPNDYNNLLIISKLYQEVNDYKNAKIYADKACHS